MPPHRNRDLALTFGREAAAYDRGRPGYPREAVDWILARVDAAPGPLRVVDLGAGTGKFTKALAATGTGTDPSTGTRLDITAVEPDPAMRARLETALAAGGVAAVDGTAERIPLADDSTDLVTMAQAWHWVDIDTASREIARVLRPGGVLALVWNVRDDAVPWVAELTRVMGSSIAEDFDTVTPPVGPPLHRDEYAEFPWVNELDHDAFLAMVASRSYVIALDGEARRRLFDDLEEFLATRADLTGSDAVPLPYLTRVTIVRSGSAG